MAEDDSAVANFSLLPEGCISDILSLTSPRDASRASAISVGFKSAADSDSVWQRFLPADYPAIIARSVSPVIFDTKKRLYFLLCDSPILIDGGKLGQEMLFVRARELSITWVDDDQYWEWRPFPQSRFSEVALLKDVCWLDIRGRFETSMLSPETTYAAYLVFKLDTMSGGLDVLAKASVRFLREAETFSNVYLKPPSRGARVRENDRLPKNRMDGWMEIELGGFYNDKGDDGQVEMALKETRYLHWKHGLIVEGIELRPKEDARICTRSTASLSRVLSPA